MAAACGGDSSPSDGGSDATTGGDATTDAPVTDAPATDGETKPDGCVPIDGGLACDPGHVACGSAACDLTTQFCCIADAGAGNTCTNYPPDSGPPPKNNCTGETKVLCDEAADCPSGQVCCGFVGATGGFATSCSTSCGTGIQFCHGSAECVTGTCTAQQCRGENIETCTTLCP
ncbi:MAG TPA: hypothetical protein VGH28_14610 [Polyangiaceae bacterium]